MAVYEELKMEIIAFEAGDVIVTSTDPTEYQDDPSVITLPFVPFNP